MANPWDDAPIVTPASAAGNPWDNAPIVQPAQSPDKSQWGSAANFGYGALKGMADLVQAPAQLALNGVNYVNQKVNPTPNEGVGKFIGAKTRQFNDYLQNQENLYQLDTPGSASAGIGRTLAGILPFVATGGTSGAPEAISAGSKAIQLGKIMAQGGLASALTQPVNNVETGQDGSNNFLQEKGVQTAIGAAGGGIGAGIGKVLGGIVSPSISASTRAAVDEGITPTIGQLLGGGFAGLENKATSLPIVGNLIKNAQRGTTEDFNRAAFNRALNPIGQNADNLPVGHEGVLAVKKALGNAYDDILSKSNFRGDAQFGNDLNQLVKMVNVGELPPTIASQFNAILNNKVLSRMTEAGTMDGQQYKAVESALFAKAKNLSGSADPDQRELGQAVNQVIDHMKGALARSNPEQAKRLADVNEGYANYVRIRGAAKGSGTDNGIFTPGQLGQAVLNLDKSAGKGDSATGQALMQDLVKVGKNIAPTYPDSGTAGRIMAGGGSLAGLAALAYTNPIAAALATGATGLGSLAYTKTGKELAAALLTKRPESFAPLANGLRQGAIPIGALTAPLVNQ